MLTLFCPIKKKEVPITECLDCPCQLKEIFQGENTPQAKCVYHITGMGVPTPHPKTSQTK